jgi:hypothetical protein
MTPIQLFSKWFDEELKRTTVRIPTACCLSTIGIDGFPNARFVFRFCPDLKFWCISALRFQKSGEAAIKDEPIASYRGLIAPANRIRKTKNYQSHFLPFGKCKPGNLIFLCSFKLFTKQNSI